MVSVFQVVGKSGAGKTVALETAVRGLRRRGLRVLVIKHSHHSLDVRGKDTDRFARSGADFVLFAGRRSALFSGRSARWWIRVLPVDVVLIEGFHQERWPGRRFRIRSPEEAIPVARAILATARAASLRRPVAVRFRARTAARTRASARAPRRGGKDER